MNAKRLSLWQIVSWALLAWIALKLLSGFHRWLAAVIVLAASGNVVLIWVIRHHAPLLRRARQWPLINAYLNLVCRLTGDPLPDALSRNRGEGLLLRNRRDFLLAAQRAMQIVRGHDAVIESMLAKMHEAVTLRKRRRGEGELPPLATFLLVGGDGVGKSYLARVLAKLLYPFEGVQAFECRRLVATTLTGSAGAPSELLRSVRREPHQLILLENVDGARAEVAQVLSGIISRGSCRDADSDRDVSFENATIVMTTTKASGLLETLAGKPLGEAAWQQQALEAIAGETNLDGVFLNQITHVYLCRDLSELAQAEVVALLMNKESAAHGVTLARVDPEIVAAQVWQLHEATGLGVLPFRIKKLLHRPLVAAAEQGHQALALRVRIAASCDLARADDE